MTFDLRWDAVHRERQWATNPCEHLCRFVGTNYPESGRGLRALDLGCGAGAQTFFMASRGFRVIGLDGSAAAIDRCAERGWERSFPAKRDDLPCFQIADMTALPFQHNEFDLVVDVASLQCLELPEAKTALAEIHRVLKTGGRFFSYSSNVGTSLEVHRGMPVRSMTRREVHELYGNLFDVRSVDTDPRTQDNGAIIVRHWIIAARKAA